MSYTEMEQVLQFIHKNFAAPHKGLNEVQSTVDMELKRIVGYMRQDATFDTLLQKYVLPSRLLQVKKPFDFDVKFIFKLPMCRYHCKKSCDNCIDLDENPAFPGYVLFKCLNGYNEDIFNKFGGNGFLHTNLVFNWMKSLLYKALNRIKNEGQIYYWEDLKEDENEIKFHTEYGSRLVISIYKNGSSAPTYYLHITVAFEFDDLSLWPNVVNPTNQWEFRIIPISPNENKCNYWQLDFSSQEKRIIKGTERLKPALRLLKLMKVNLNHKRVPNYALTSLMLEVAQDPYIWKKSLSETFMLVFGEYLKCFEYERVPYFWNKDANLIENMKRDTITNHHNELLRLYIKIDREYKNDPTVVAKVILKGEDYNTFLKIWRSPESLGLSDDNDDGEGNLAVLDNAATAAAVAVGVVGAFALGATIWNHFSNNRNS